MYIHFDLSSRYPSGIMEQVEQQLQKFTEFDYSIVSLCRRIWTQFYAGADIFPSIFSFSHFVDGTYVTYTNSGYFGIIALQFSFRLARICRFSSTMKIKRNVKSEEI